MPAVAARSVGHPLLHTRPGARFHRALRHSRVVGFLRLALPAAVGLVMAVIVALATFLNPFRGPGDTPGPGLDGTRLVGAMQLEGSTPDHRPYAISARQRIQDVLDPDHTELKGLHGTMRMADSSILVLDAGGGVFDSRARLLDLRDKVVLRSADGEEARLSQARVDMAGGSITSDQPVLVTMGGAILTSDRLAIREGGAVLHFEGNVVMNVEKFGN
ncbi:MAG: LPS export ABC transporter periplasmic protein LptC [Alphaproteobacteria bacterium]|nr:LPS export ABC transporter periplasmic protein LptC [Alphaproteobacteria bacterium]